MNELNDISKQLFDSQVVFKEKSLNKRRFKHTEVETLIESKKGNNVYGISQVGESFEGRSISLIKFGSGSTKVAMWSQMHGDEPTATMAIFDLLNFFEGENDGFEEFRKQILEHLTIYIIPMLNPDGAERYIRRTAQGIDMNRDAMAKQTPESKILANLIQTEKPDFAFNLHDQNPRYSAGLTPNLATISFLATSYDYALSMNETRKKSMQLIAELNGMLQGIIPNQVGRFSDDHEPRAFGDTIQKWGSSLVLVESGGYKNDPEKQYIRKLNYTILLSSFYSIANKTYEQKKTESYFEIPVNERAIYDLLIRNVSIKTGTESSYIVDYGIDRLEVNYNQASNFYYKGTVEELGDLHTKYGNEELDATGLQIESGKVYSIVINAVEQLHELNFNKLHAEGYTYIKASLNLISKIDEDLLKKIPMHILTAHSEFYPSIPLLEDCATFVLKKENNINRVVINGFLYDPFTKYDKIGNGIVTE